jgi:putative methionine-R-sulfoxide reductase with GAF domain
VHESIELQTVLKSAADSLVDNIDSVDNVSIFLVEGDKAVIKAYKGFPKWFINKTSAIPYPRGFTWHTIIKGQTRYCRDVDKDKIIGPAGRKVGIKSYFSVPFQYEGNTVGCINFNSRTRDAFDREELILLENVTIQIEAAVKNAKQAEELITSEKTLNNLYMKKKYYLKNYIIELRTICKLYLVC